MHILFCYMYMLEIARLYNYTIQFTADNQLNAKPRSSKDVRMQHFRIHKEDAINVIRTHLAYIANVKKPCHIKQQFTVLKARAS